MPVHNKYLVDVSIISHTGAWILHFSEPLRLAAVSAAFTLGSAGEVKPTRFTICPSRCPMY